MKRVNTVRVNLWGTTVGYLHQNETGMIGFQYDNDFLGATLRFHQSKCLYLPLPTLSHL